MQIIVQAVNGNQRGVASDPIDFAAGNGYRNPLNRVSQRRGYRAQGLSARRSWMRLDEAGLQNGHGDPTPARA